MCLITLLFDDFDVFDDSDGFDDLDVFDDFNVFGDEFDVFDEFDVLDVPLMCLMTLHVQHLGVKVDSFHPSTPRSFYGLTRNKVST